MTPKWEQKLSGCVLIGIPKYVRKILPKNVNFDALEQEKINLTMAYDNADIRQSQSDHTPDVFEFILGKGITANLHIATIDPQAVCLKPRLIGIEMKERGSDIADFAPGTSFRHLKTASMVSLAPRSMSSR